MDQVVVVRERVLGGYHDWLLQRARTHAFAQLVLHDPSPRAQGTVHLKYTVRQIRDPRPKRPQNAMEFLPHWE